MNKTLILALALCLFSQVNAKNAAVIAKIDKYNTELCELGSVLIQQMITELRNGHDSSSLLALMKEKLPENQIPMAIDTLNQAKSDIRFNVTFERSKSRFLTDCLAGIYPSYKFLMDSYASKMD